MSSSARIRGPCFLLASAQTNSPIRPTTHNPAYTNQVAWPAPTHPSHPESQPKAVMSTTNQKAAAAPSAMSRNQITSTHPGMSLTCGFSGTARSVQVVTEEIIMRMARHVHAQTGLHRLCLAGGVALNCVANGRLLRDGPFEDIWIQPAAGDAGGALGAAFFTWFSYLDNPRTPDSRMQKASYLGPEFSDDAIEAYLKEKQIPYIRLERSAIPRTVAELVEQQNVVGWFQGRMEFGPRALGSRSILGDPRSPSMQSVINLKIKFRESFRPFAPTVLEDRVSDYFELDRESPYMLIVAPVRQDRLARPGSEAESLSGLDKRRVIRSEIPAVTHVDNSARIQTVRHSDNPLYHEMISAFAERTGCPLLINTSFNVRGEPIVCTPDDAFTCFMRTQMDYLIMGSFLLDKNEQKPWTERAERTRQDVLD